MRERQDRGTVSIRSALTRSALALLVASVLAGCSWFSSTPDVPNASTVSVFSVQPGQCFTAPGEIKAELSELQTVPCTQAHRQEAYASIAYQAPDGVDGTIYPGDATLTSFAQGSCAQAFAQYVGVSYLDSSLYFTYLLPSARSWEQGEDRSVVCFVITTGADLTVSAKGSKL